MIHNFYWLTDDQFAWLAPLLPTGTRGKPRVDDRRVISGIVHVLKSGADAGSMRPTSMGHAKRSTIVSSAGRRKAYGSTFFIRSPRRADLPRKLRRIAVHPESKGETQSGDWSLDCRPIAFLLTGGHVADCTADALLLEQMPPSLILHADEVTTATPSADRSGPEGPCPTSRPKPIASGRTASRLSSNATTTPSSECSVLKDFRRIATRYDRLAANFLAAVCLAAGLLVMNPEPRARTRP